MFATKYTPDQIEHAGSIQTIPSFNMEGSSSGRDGHKSDHLGNGKQVFVGTHRSL